MIKNTTVNFILASLIIFSGFYGCKRSENSETLSSTTIKGKQYDLTTFTTNDSKLYDECKQEHNEFKYEHDLKMAQPLFRKYKGPLSDAELVALYMYTDNLYSKLNRELRNKDAQSIGKYDATVLTLASAINKLPKKSCVAFRATSLSKDEISKILKTNYFVDRAFLSTSVSWSYLIFQGNVEFYIHSNSCRNVSGYSRHPDESEVLFPPGSEFRLLQYKYIKDQGKYIFIVQHVSPGEKNKPVPQGILAKASARFGKTLYPLRIVAGATSVIINSINGYEFPIPPGDPRRKPPSVTLSLFDSDNIDGSEILPTQE